MNMNPYRGRLWPVGGGRRLVVRLHPRGYPLPSVGLCLPFPPHSPPPRTLGGHRYPLRMNSLPLRGSPVRYGEGLRAWGPGIGYRVLYSIYATVPRITQYRSLVPKVIIIPGPGGNQVSNRESDPRGGEGVFPGCILR